MEVSIILLKNHQGHSAGESFSCSKNDAEKLVAAGIAEIIVDCKSFSGSDKSRIQKAVAEVLAEATGKETGSFNAASVLQNQYGQQDSKKFWFGNDDAPSLEDYGVKNIGEFCQIVQNKGTFQASGKALSSLVNTEGGFLVPDDFSREVIHSVLVAMPWIQQMFQITMDGSSKTIPYLVDEDRSGSNGMYGLGLPGKRSIAEGSALSDISPTFSQLRLHLNKVGGYAYVSNEMMSDSPVAIGALLQKVFTDALTYEMANQIINGSGAGECLGILNSPSKIEIAKVSGQSADTIVFTNILSMWARLSPEAKRDSVWLINDDCIPELYKMSVDSSGNSPVMIINKNAQTALGNNIFGRPIYWTEAAATLGDAGDVILFSPSSVALGRKPEGIRIENSQEFRFTNDQATFRALLRLDSQSLWKTARTPLKSSTTVSNIITIQERT